MKTGAPAGDRALSTRAYVEHVAVRVADIRWHIRFFQDVLGMTMREVDGSTAEPRQYWTLGGLQFVAEPEFRGPEGRLAHLGMMCEDLEAALAAAATFGATAEGRSRARISP